MRNRDRERFAVLLNGMAATFRQQPTEALLTGYWIGLSDLPIEAVEVAVGRAIRECRFLPCVAELRELAGEQSADDAAVLAWAALERAVEDHGAYASVDFDDPTINAAVRNLGGWERVCSLPDEEFDKWFRREFERVYKSLRKTGVPDEACLPLGGYCDRMNAGLGYAQYVREPARIATGISTPRRIGTAAQREALGYVATIGLERSES